MDLVAFNRAISAARGNIFHAPLENTRALAASAFTNPSITSYPLAFTRVLGHLQSNRAGIPWFQYIINQINKTIFDIDRPDPPPPNSDDEDVPPPPFDPFRYNNDPEVLGVDAIVPYLRWVALENISAQFYIEAMHRFRASAVEHEAQLGLVGSAAAGSHAKNDKAARIADKMAARVDHDHPSDRFDTLVQDDSIPRDLRMENVYVLHFDHMAPEHRNGRFLFKNVIKPLTDGWSHPHVKNAIVDNIAVLDADVFPRLISWASAPISIAIKIIYNHVKPDVILRNPVSPFFVESLSMLERAQNYCHTGNPAVLVKALMHPALLSLGLMTTGFPALWSSFPFSSTSTASTDLEFLSSVWPVRKNGLPQTCSGRAQTITYGKDHFLVYKAMFDILHIIHCTPESRWKDEPRDRRQWRYIAALIFRVWKDDVFNLVTEGVVKSVNSLSAASQDPTFKAFQVTRMDALDNWAQSKFPLGSAPSSLSPLILALKDKPSLSNPTHLPPAH
ncbi:hypothetical protein DENSPDRAFT_887035, partial [Dentipellis sp. KUC8613]